MSERPAGYGRGPRAARSSASALASTRAATPLSTPVAFVPIRVEPAYRRVAAALLGRITARAIAPGDRLPPEMELARQFGVHRGTVREALRELETNGVLKRERGSKLMMVTRPSRGSVAANVSRALSLHDVTYHDVWEALTVLEPPMAAAAARGRTAQDLAHLDGLVARLDAKASTDDAVTQAAAFFRAIGEATHNGVFMLAHEPLVELLVPSLGAMIDEVPQARARIADAQKKVVGAIRGADAAAAADWMSKHIRDFRRGFEIAKIALTRPIGAG
jgi:GntR family transcriptional regulator, transcriptional repressor for pyruvate dehydrogenase complex